MTNPARSIASEMPKQYRPDEHEGVVRARWDDARAFHADPGRVLRGEAEPYCVLIPPPNVTAALHLGHGLNNTLQDVLVRAHRMKGYETLWMPGTDHAGIATQTVVERRVRTMEGKARTDFAREAFVAKIQAFKDEYEAKIVEQLKRIGCSCDWERQRFTMDEVCARAVREAFFQLFRDGLIYRGKRLVNWDPVTQTALADDEVEMRDVDGQFFYLRYPLVHVAATGERPRPVTWSELASRGYPGAGEQAGDTQAWVTVATTRPETYLGDTAVAVNPKDPRAAALRGLMVELPLVGRVIPVVEDDYVVMPASLGGDGADPKAAFATGFLKVTPAHDTNDYEIGRRHSLPVINIMAPDASISDKHGWSDVGEARTFVGKSREEARKSVVRAFDARRLLEGRKPYRHAVGHSYRSQAAIEPYLSDQWYVRVTDDRMKGAALRAMGVECDETSRDREGAVCSSPIPTSRDREEAVPFRHYLITFSTYGSWLHGDERGSVDRHHNAPGTPRIHPDVEREAAESASLSRSPVELSTSQRPVVAAAIADVCAHRGWTLLACNVRTNHVHVVVTADQTPERAMIDFKSYATRALRTLDPTMGEHVWSRHGSTRYIDSESSLAAAVRYTLEEQGEDLGGVIRCEGRGGASNDAGTGPLPHGRGSLGGEPLPHGRGSSSRDIDDCKAGLSFFPSRYAKTYQSWHENIRDWCISRQLWWGHRIPVWHIEVRATLPTGDHREREDARRRAHSMFSVVLKRFGVAESDWSMVDVADEPLAFEVSTRSELASEVLDDIAALWGAPRALIDTKRQSGQPSATISYPELKHIGKYDEDAHAFELDCSIFTRDPDVLDTWFSSALWPMSTMGWPDAGAAARDTGIADMPLLLDAFNPSNVLVTGRDIITLWVSRMVMFNRYFMPPEGEPCETGSAPGAPSRLADSVAWAASRAIDDARGPVPGLGEGRLPFRHVYINPIIQDGHGQRMSKSLGNGVDPLDIVESHGADALRFVLTQVATSTQDVRLPVDLVCPHTGKTFTPKFITSSTGHQVPAPVQESPGNPGKKMVTAFGVASGQAEASAEMPVARNSSAKFDLGRNFATKLWNAARLTISLIESAGGSGAAGPAVRTGDLSSADRWMLSRVAGTVRKVDEALRNYEFSVYAQAMYDLLWRDFCDWYLEAVKPSAGSSVAQRAVLRVSLNAIVRLLHPIMPHVTEVVWGFLRQCPEARIEGLDLGAAGELLCRAPWPRITSDLAGTGAEEPFGRVVEVVSAVREVRAKLQVPPKRLVTLHLPSELASSLAAHGDDRLVMSLAGADACVTAAPPAGAAEFTVGAARLAISNLADAMDAGQERARLEKSVADLRKSIAALEGRLNNPGYADRAPAHLVQQSRDELARKREELAIAEGAMRKLG